MVIKNHSGILSTGSIIREIHSRIGYEESVSPVPLLEERFDIINDITNQTVITEAEYKKIVDHFKLEITDVEKFVKVNDLQPITNPVTYSRPGIPTDDGLLSNKIFGITKDDRAGIFGYIDLHGTFIDPSCYKTWVSMDGRIKGIVHGSQRYRINDKGELVEDPNGETGIPFLIKNFDKIKMKSTESVKRDVKIQYLQYNKDRMFIKKYPVIPPFYRDTNTSSNGSVAVGGINKLYSSLIQSVNGKMTTRDYGFDDTYAMDGRIQETLLMIYDWFAGNTNPNITVEPGAGISSKKGILRRANMTKTSNYASRHVITATELKAEKVENIMVNMEYSAAPLAAVIADARPFVMFHVKRFFENEFLGTESYPVYNEKGEQTYAILQDPMIEFSDERIKREMDRFLHGHNNRFVPIKLPVKDANGKVYYMQFKGRANRDKDDPGIINRKLTWCDVFYQAAVESVKDKYALITRFPIDSYFNQITTKLVVSSTKKTMPLYINDTYYPYYPVISNDEIGSNTGNKFVDTMQISNLYLPGLGADFDGDTISLRIIYTKEANDEAAEFFVSKRNYIDLGGSNIRKSSGDVIQSIYSLTKILPETKLTKPEFG